MGIGEYFSGSALHPVGTAGDVALPGFVIEVIERRSAAPRLVVAPHECDPCLNGYDESYQPVLQTDIERRRLREEAAGMAAAWHHVRVRRTFGLAERAEVDGAGRVRLPPLMRSKGRIEDLALFIGTGGGFEIWNPHVARSAGDPELRELAEYRLFQHVNGNESEARR